MQSSQFQESDLERSQETRQEAVMPHGPDGQQRPSDTVKCAVTVAKIATGEIDDESVSRRRNGVE